MSTSTIKNAAYKRRIFAARVCHATDRAVNYVRTCEAWFGMYPFRWHQDDIPRNTEMPIQYKGRVLAVLAMNLMLFSLTVTVIQFQHEQAGTILNVATISSIITGIKPLQNCVNILIFFVFRKRNVRALNMLNVVDCAMRNTYSASPRIRKTLTSVYTVIIATCSISVLLRMIEFIWTLTLRRQIESLPEFINMTTTMAAEVPADGEPEPYMGPDVVAAVAEYLDYISPFIVLALNIWQFLPLLYFVVLCSVTRYWFQLLGREMQKDSNLQAQSMKFYHNQFMLLTCLVKCLRQLFDAFLFFSLSFSVFILSMTIYFIAESTEILTPIRHHANDSAMFRIEADMGEINTYFQIIWSVCQICIAVIYITTICACGTTVNESARRIRRVILAQVPQNDADRYEALWFLETIQSQHEWGMSLWKVFPLERSLMFTIISAMGTYAVLLLRLRPPDISCGPNTNTSSIINTTPAPMA